MEIPLREKEIVTPLRHISWRVEPHHNLFFYLFLFFQWIAHYYQQQQPFVRIGFEQNSTYEAAKGLQKCHFNILTHNIFYGNNYLNLLNLYKNVVR